MQYAPNISLPAQMIPLARKNEKWRKGNVDRLHEIGKSQIRGKYHMYENYQIINGKFFMHHYMDDDGVRDMLYALQQDFNIPKHLRHYDIIGKVVRIMVGEYTKRPDIFRAQDLSDEASNNFMREKSRLLLRYVMEEINADIDKQLVEMGLDPNFDDFETQEEAEAYYQEIDARRKEMTPEAVQKYMLTDWMDAAEIWANNRLKANTHQKRRKERNRVEFADMLTVAECYRHFYLRGDDYGYETWNPPTVFSHTDEDTEWVQEGDYVGRIIYLSPGTVVDRYGRKMSDNDIRRLDSDNNNLVTGRPEGRTFVPEAYTIPYEGFEEKQRLKDLAGIDPDIPVIDDNEFSSSPFTLHNEGLIEVCEGYWKSFRKIGLLTYEEDDLQHQTWVDETFIVPDWIREVKADDIDFEPDLGNTIVWTYVPDVMSFVKICPKDKDTENIYIVERAPFQFKGDSKMYGSLLPVAGRVVNARNSKPMSIVDLMKPDQIGHNVSMNQAYEIMQREVGRFFLFDPAFLPNWKDWAGERGFEKVMTLARSLGAAPVDSAAATKKGGSFNNWQMIDLDESARLLSRIQIADHFEAKALSRVGFTPQRLGSTQASESATGIEIATTQSYASTESWFTMFSEYEQRCLTMELQLAQFVESTRGDGTVHYTQSDMSRGFIKFAGTDLLLAEMGVVIHDSQEVTRMLETARQMGLQNPNTGATMDDLWTLISSNSPAEIKNQLKASAQNIQQREAEKNQIAQQQIQADLQKHEQELAQDKEIALLEMDNELEKAYIQNFGYNQNNTLDGDANGVPDALEYDKLSQKASAEASKNSLAIRKQAHAEQESRAKAALDQAKLRMEEKKLQSAERIAKMNKNKYDAKAKAKKKK